MCIRDRFPYRSVAPIFVIGRISRQLRLHRLGGSWPRTRRGESSTTPTRSAQPHCERRKARSNVERSRRSMPVQAISLQRSLTPPSACWGGPCRLRRDSRPPVSYTHLRAHETVLDLVCRLLLE